MDATQHTELRSWASRLEERAAGDDELRAAAKAILMLVDEVENLQAKVVVAQAAVPPPVAAEPEPEPEPEPAPPAAVSDSFFSRVKRTLGFE